MCRAGYARQPVAALELAMPTSGKKPLVIVTRKLPEAVETRMRELFDARLNARRQADEPGRARRGGEGGARAGARP